MTSEADANAFSLPFATPGEILASAIVLPVLGIIAVCLRFVARKKQRASLGLDDLTITLALVRATGPFSVESSKLIWNAKLCTIGMGVVLIYGLKPIVPPAATCANSAIGESRGVIGYSTPQLPNASPETQLTEIVPEQSFAELVSFEFPLLSCL